MTIVKLKIAAKKKSTGVEWPGTERKMRKSRGDFRRNDENENVDKTTKRETVENKWVREKCVVNN